MRLVCSVLLACFSAPVWASEHVADTPVPGGAGLTAHDLLVKVMPDLERNDTDLAGSQPVTLRLLLEPEFEAYPHNIISVDSVQLQPLGSGGEDHLLLLASLGPGEFAVADVVLLALFDEDFDLLDAANVGLDRVTSFGEPPLLQIGRNSEAVIITNQHWNSNQAYSDIALIGVHEERLTMLASFFMLSDQACGFANTQSVEFSTLAEGPGPWPLVAILHEERTLDPACDPGQELAPASSQRLELTLNWDENVGHYIHTPEGAWALEQWRRATEARF